LQRSQLEGLIAEGLVHSRLKLREAKELVARFRPGNGQRAAKGPNVTQRFENFEEFIAATLEDWSPEQRDWAHGKLEAITFLVESNPDSFHLPLPSRRARADIFPSQQAEPAVNFKSRIFPERIL